MAYKIDYLDGAVLRWTLTEDGADFVRDDTYAPTIYVSAHGEGSLGDAAAHLRTHHLVERVLTRTERLTFRHDPETVLAVDLAGIEAVRSVAGEIAGWGKPGQYRPYNVDFSREFRYCLEEDVDPSPSRGLSVVGVAVEETDLASPPITRIRVDNEAYESTPVDVLDRVVEHVRRADPDVLRLNTSDLVPALFEQADAYDVDGFRLGRLPGWQRLAGASTYESYGRVGYSPARYNVPGRVIIDESNAFFWDRTNRYGRLDLVARSRKPLQELSWSSIGNVLTAIQIREARDRGVLVPWRSWRHEQFKTMRQLREADRGGFTFAPDPGLHEDVHELDFSSLYPNIIVTRNVSPEKIRCDCHADREDVPGLGYGICDERGYLPDVLEPLVADRDRLKAELRDVDDPARRAELEGRANALKWILVSCFGYQGFSNAKFGRIECHEAINAFAREILLDTKETLEANGWRIVHGIVDSVWVTPRDGTAQTPLEDLVARITDAVGVRLEYEARYDWIAFVPMRNSDAGALTKYFGKRAGDSEYTYRGVECRQRSTPAFVEDAQKELIEVVGRERDPAAVCDRLRVWLDRLRRGDVDPGRLLITNRVSRSREAYSRYTRNVAALERAENRGLSRSPGQRVEYVVVDDGRASPSRVALAGEDPEEYDTAFYRDRLLRAAESVVSPLGWRRADIERYLSDVTDSHLSAFV